MKQLSEISTEELIMMRDGHFDQWKEFIRLANTKCQSSIKSTLRSRIALLQIRLTWSKTNEIIPYLLFNHCCVFSMRYGLFFHH